MKIRQSIFGFLMFLALITAPAVKAQDGLLGAFSIADPRGASLPGHAPQLAAADFDNDQKPDGALLREAGLLNGERAFRIELHVTAGSNNSITFSSDESGLSISALDVNRDGSPDLIIERAFTHERLQIFLNDGHGGFHQVRAEDYPSSDPSAPAWHARRAQLHPVFALPVSRGSDAGAPQRSSLLHRDPSNKLKLWCEDLLIQSAARAPSSSRAPPILSL